MNLMQPMPDTTQGSMGGLDEDKKKELYDSLMGKFNAVNSEQDAKFKEAQDSANTKRGIGGIIDGIVQLGNANAVARGMPGSKTTGGDILRHSADDSVSDAAAQRKSAIEQFLFQNEAKDKIDNKVDSQTMGAQDRAMKAEDRTNRMTQQEHENQFQQDKLDAEKGWNNDRINATIAGNRLQAQTSHDNKQIAQQQRDDAKTDKRAEEERARTTQFGVARTADDAKQIKQAGELKSDFDNKITEMIDLRKKHGGGAMLDREDVGRGKQLSKELLLLYKDMAKLGVLSKSDENILNAIIPSDPLEYNLSGIVGQDPTMTRLKTFQKDTNNDFQARLKNRLDPNSSMASAPTAPDKQQVSNGNSGKPETTQDWTKTIKSTPIPPGKIMVSNGKDEPMLIDPSKLAGAQAEGWQVVGGDAEPKVAGR